MFLSKKLAEWEWAGQCSRSKQGLFCLGFFLSIPVLNGLSDRSKSIKGLVMPFFTLFSSFQPVLPIKPVQKIIRRLNYIIFDRDLTIFCQNPFNTVLWLCFSLSRGQFFSIKYLSNLSVDSDWTGLNPKKRLEWGCDFLRLSSFKCNTQSILWL